MTDGIPPPGRAGRTARGAISELRACAYLMAADYYVFRCESPHAPFDLVAYKDGVCHRVEVKSISRVSELTPAARQNPDRCAPSFSWPVNDDWDLLIVVDHRQDRILRFTSDMSRDAIRNSVREAYGFPPKPPGPWNKGMRRSAA